MIEIAAVILSGFPLGFLSHKLLYPVTKALPVPWRYLMRYVSGCSMVLCLLGLLTVVSDLCDWQMVIALGLVDVALGLGVAIGYWHTGGELTL